MYTDTTATPPKIAEQCEGAHGPVLHRIDLFVGNIEQLDKELWQIDIGRDERGGSESIKKSDKVDRLEEVSCRARSKACLERLRLTCRNLTIYAFCSSDCADPI